MAADQPIPGSSRDIQNVHYPLTCENCYASYGEFCYIYTNSIQKLIVMSESWCFIEGKVMSNL